MRKAILAGFILAGALFAACSGDEGGDAGEATTELRPASTVGAERSATAAATVSEAKVLNIGESATLNGDVKVTITAIDLAPHIMQGGRERQPGAGEKFALITLRIDNAGATDRTVDVTVTCSGAKDGARYSYTETGALDPNKLVPSKSFAEGAILMGVPGSCTNGRITVKPVGAFTEKDPQKIAVWNLTP